MVYFLLSNLKYLFYIFNMKQKKEEPEGSSFSFLF